MPSLFGVYLHVGQACITMFVDSDWYCADRAHTHTTKHNKTARPIRKNCGLVGHARCGLFGLVLCRSCTHSIERPIRINCVLAVARDWLVGVRSVKRTLLCLWLVDDSSVERTLFSRKFCFKNILCFMTKFLLIKLYCAQLSKPAHQSTS